MELKVLIGTMTGTAQLVAQEIERSRGDVDMRVVTLLIDRLDARVFGDGGIFLICTSTFGQGDVPDNAKNRFVSLAQIRPNLSKARYGVIALGDHTYTETFCFGGKRFDARLSKLGAQRGGDVLRHDASAGTLAEEVALEWIGAWIALARAGASVAA